MKKSDLREIVKKSVEDVWYNSRSRNPVEDQIETLTESLFQALNNEPLCEYCKKPLENTTCNDCLEEMDSHNN
jgi:recombinational DNA repair protein RecR